MVKRRRTWDRVFGIRVVVRRLFALFRQPLFIVVTVWGNLCILVGAGLFHSFESSRGISYLDSLVVAIGLVSTAGFGEVLPTTAGGKITCIALMIGGAVFLWTYMGLIVGSLVTPELDQVERDIRHIEREVRADDLAVARMLARLDDLRDDVLRLTKDRERPPSPGRHE